MKIKDYELPDGLYYHEENMWLRLEEKESGIVGVTDYGQDLAGEINFVELPLEGDEVEKDEEVGTLETGKYVGKIYAPVSGKIQKVNQKLWDNPELINKEPYGDGWIFKIKIYNKQEIEDLMKGEKAKEWLKKELEEN